MQQVDVIIIGQGLAGTALAWELRSRGSRIAIIDPGLPETCSRSAAGLVTPVTGLRATLSWRWRETWNKATTFYPAIERRLATRFWHVQPSVRLYQSAQQRLDFEQRFKQWPEVGIQSPYPWPQPCPPPGIIHAPHGAFSMAPAARLDTARYLDASRAYFRRTAIVREAHFDWTDIVSRDNDQFALPRHGLETAHLVSCQGMAATCGPFQRLNLQPARGDILSLQCERLDLRHVLHGQTWLIPDDTSPASYLAGSTYDRDNLDCRDQGGQRARLEQRLQRFLLAPFSVTGQRSGVRPTTTDQKPLLGAHPHMPHLWVFNGLGSKGAVLAPWSAAHLATAMLDSHPIDRELDWLRGPA